MNEYKQLHAMPRIFAPPLPSLSADILAAAIRDSASMPITFDCPGQAILQSQEDEPKMNDTE
jgi:hypothetical protein